MAFVGLLQERKMEEVMEEVQESCLPLIGKGMKLMLPADMIAYTLIPQQNRTLWVDLVDIIWIVILA